MNVAAVEGTPPPGQGAPVRVESNMVVVRAVEPKGQVIGEKVGPPAVCAVKPGTLVLKGVGGPKRHKFTVEVRSAGLKQVTFFLDGRKIKTFSASKSLRAEVLQGQNRPRQARQGAPPRFGRRACSPTPSAPR